MVQVKTTTPMIPGSVYSITATNILDCRHNPIGPVNKVKVGLPGEPLAGEWVINEILFDPGPNANDYVEFYNNSSKIFNAAKFHIANRNSTGVISSIKALSNGDFLIFPGDHIVVTEDAENLSLQYLVKYPENILTPGSLPSFPDDEGTVIVLNSQGIVIDEVHYRDDWHFNLIENAEGVALERIDA
jgi:hypothetical protein